MKVLIFPLFIFIVLFILYFYSFFQKKKHKKINGKIICAIVLLSLVILGFGIYKMRQAEKAPDTQCTTAHVTTSHPPISLTTYQDYFLQGNYLYDTGNCKEAIKSYTKSIVLNPTYPQAYNNRAYTYMRMQDYKDALPDLHKALALNPNYIQALMNRGDVHNYYYQIDRQSAIRDYEKVISLGGTQETSVCGHLFLARHNGWTIQTILDFPLGRFSRCD